MSQQNPTTTLYTSLRIETYKTGEGRRRYTFDGRTEEKLAEARNFANAKFLDGHKVVFYRLDKVQTSDGKVEWNRVDLGEADGRKEAPKAPKASKKPSTPKTSRKVVTPKAACEASEVTARLDRLEKTVGDLAKAVNVLVQVISKK